jgi:hypothetical protein
MRKIYTTFLVAMMAAFARAQENRTLAYCQRRPLRTEANAAKKADCFLTTGFSFPARLETAVFSYNIETPAVAILDRNISFLDKVVLPAGARIIGTVAVQKSHDRINLAFATIVFPNGDELKFSGIALSLDGSAGLKGKVENQRLCGEPLCLSSVPSYSSVDDDRIIPVSPHNLPPLHIVKDAASRPVAPSIDDFSSRFRRAIPEVSLGDPPAWAPTRSPHIAAVQIAAKLCAYAPNWHGHRCPRWS